MQRLSTHETVLDCLAHCKGIHLCYPDVSLVWLPSVLRINLWRLFANFRRIDNELERIRVLIPFHQFQKSESPGALYGIAGGKLLLYRFEQIGRHRVLPVCVKAIGCFDDLRLREGQIVNKEFPTICPAGMSQTLKVPPSTLRFDRRFGRSHARIGFSKADGHHADGPGDPAG